MKFENNCMNYEQIKTYESKNTVVNAIIETPKGSRNKYKYNPTMQIFELDKILPAGAVFPFNFGFIPRTRGADGDPLDIILIMDDSSYPGCLMKSRILGIVKATQTEEGKPKRNDRLIGVPVDSFTNNDLRTIQDLNENVITEIENFFISYHAQRGTEFKPLGVGGPAAALKIIKDGKE